MKTQDIRNMGLAYVQVLESGKKKEKPEKGETAAHEKSEKDDMDEALVGNQHKIDANKNGKIDAHDFKLLRKDKKVAEEAEQTDEAVGTAAKYAGKTGVMGDKYSSTDRMMDMKNFNKVRTQRAAQRDAEHQKQDPKTAAAGYAKHMVDTDKAKKKAAARGVDASHLNWKHTNGVNRGKLPESTEWPIFARIQEKVNQTKGATPPESMEDRLTASDKKMVAGHGGLGVKTPEDFVDDNKIDIGMSANVYKAGNVKVAPKRHNDQTVGDKTMPKAK